MSNDQHNSYIAYVFIAHGLFMLAITAFIAIVFFFVFSQGPTPGDPQPPPFFFGIFFTFMAAIYSFFWIPSFVAAYGLLKKRSWARVASIAAGVISAMNMPIGTAAAIYSLWFFFSDNWKEIYADGASGGSATPLIANGQEAAWQSRVTGEYSYSENEIRTPPDWR